MTMEMLDKYKDEMDDVVYRRCSFVINENQRLLDGCAALEKGDYVTFGQKVFGSHEGLSKWYEVSCKELDFLVDIARKNPGVLGARMMGGGFGGCTINIVKTEAYDAYVAEITVHIRSDNRVGPSANGRFVLAITGMTATKSSILLPSTFTRSTQNVIMKKVLFISIIVLLGTGLFSGCKNDKDQTYLYAIGIDGYAYDGSTLLGPMLYLESLGIAKSLSIVSTDQQDADKQAIVRFDAEMGKIDAATLASYGNTVYVRYVLQTLGEEQTTIQEKEFGQK